MNELTISKETAIEKMNAIKAFQSIVKSQLIEGEDFGTVAGVPKPFLFKSGAEKILSILGVSYEKPEYTEIWKEITIGEARIPYYEVVCKVMAKIGDSIIGFGIGSCNTLERKYCYSKKEETLITDPIHYYGLKNTILKMAEKKAKVDLALHIGALSNIFTQDEDNIIEESNKPDNQKTQPPNGKEKPSQRQIDYLINLLEQNKKNVALVKKAGQIAKLKRVENRIEVEGSKNDVSEAISLLIANSNQKDEGNEQDGKIFRQNG